VTGRDEGLSWTGADRFAALNRDAILDASKRRIRASTSAMWAIAMA
jgi:hypothetical protein